MAVPCVRATTERREKTEDVILDSSAPLVNKRREEVASVLHEETLPTAQVEIANANAGPRSETWAHVLAKDVNTTARHQADIGGVRHSMPSPLLVTTR